MIGLGERLGLHIRRNRGPVNRHTLTLADNNLRGNNGQEVVGNSHFKRIKHLIGKFTGSLSRSWASSAPPSLLSLVYANTSMASRSCNFTCSINFALLPLSTRGGGNKNTANKLRTPLVFLLLFRTNAPREFPDRLSVTRIHRSLYPRRRHFSRATSLNRHSTSLSSATALDDEEEFPT